jgi:hypothetical protein
LQFLHTFVKTIKVKLIWLYIWKTRRSAEVRHGGKLAKFGPSWQAAWEKSLRASSQ